MKKIKLESARPGMRLAKPIENDSGMTLYGVGNELTAQAIDRMGSLGIEAIYVEGQGQVRLTPEAYRQTVERAFSKAGDSALMIRLKGVLTTHMERVAGDGQNS